MSGSLRNLPSLDGDQEGIKGMVPHYSSTIDVAGTKVINYLWRCGVLVYSRFLIIVVLIVITVIGLVTILNLESLLVTICPFNLYCSPLRAIPACYLSQITLFLISKVCCLCQPLRLNIFTITK